MAFFHKLQFSGKGSKGARGQKGLALRSKLLLMLLISSMTAILVMAVLDYQHGRNRLEQNVKDKLDALRVSKSNQIEWYFNNMRSMISVLGESNAVRDALAEFKEGFEHQFSDATLTPDQTKALSHFYQKDFLPKLEQINKGGNLIVELFWPRTKAGQVAQGLYIAENKNKIGEKDEMFQSSAKGVYDESHAKYHGFFRDAIRRLKFDDMFLIDGETGQIVYSVFKEADYGTNLLKGPYAHTSLGRLFQGIKNDNQKGGVLMTDFQRYAPSYNMPSAFIGTPVYSEKGKFIGVLAAQFSSQELGKFMHGRKDLETLALGKTGEIYLVGDDKLLRSDSRSLARDKKSYLTTLRRAHIQEPDIEKIDKLNTSILLHHSDTEAVQKAFEGQNGRFLNEGLSWSRSYCFLRTA